MRPKFVFDTSLESLNSSKSIKILPLEKIIPLIEPGDLIFNIARNDNLGVYCGLKWGQNSVVTHAGIINIEQDQPWILEAVTDGVRYIPLEESLLLYHTELVFIRKLEGTRDIDFSDILTHYYSKHKQDTHKITNSKGMWEMILAAIDPKLPFTSKEILMNHRNSNGLFCSELVAQILMEEDILPDDKGDYFPDSNEYVPSDFTTFCTKTDNDEYITLNTKLKHGFQLGEEIFIDFNIKKLEKERYSIFRIIN